MLMRQIHALQSSKPGANVTGVGRISLNWLLEQHLLPVNDMQEGMLNDSCPQMLACLLAASANSP